MQFSDRSQLGFQICRIRTATQLLDCFHSIHVQGPFLLEVLAKLIILKKISNNH